jgi:hypothetical protein
MLKVSVINGKSMNRILILIAFLATAEISADDYETATQFITGDVISAEVLNDILDRIELALITPKSSDFVGSWDLLQTTTASGCLGNGGDCTLSGRQTPVDNIYSQRTDSVTFSNDGDGTFSLSTSSYCPFLQGAQNSPCNISFAVIDGRFLIHYSGARYAYNVQKISASRFILSVWATGSQSFNVLQLDKQSLPPKSPKNLAIALTSTKASLTWTAGDTSETSYTIKRKSSAAASFSDLGTSTAESYEDTTIVKGNSYWYRVFGIDSDGTSLGSNVIQITYSNTPPSMNLGSTISINEGTTVVVDVSATDADGDSMTYSITSSSPGNDASTMSISTSGQLSFNSAPDYENPGDYDSNNVYDITVSVSDGYDTVSQDLGLVVLDMDD